MPPPGPSVLMFIHCDITEPGLIPQALRVMAADSGIDVHRSILHKRAGSGKALRTKHPFYGLGADYLIATSDGSRVAAIERKTMDDLARDVTLGPREMQGRVFRQLRDLRNHPCPILLIEGTPTPLYLRVEPALLGLQFWCAREGIACMHTSSPHATARALLYITRRLQRELEQVAPSSGQVRGDGARRPQPLS